MQRAACWLHTTHYTYLQETLHQSQTLQWTDPDTKVKHICYTPYFRGDCGRKMVLGKFKCLGIFFIWIIVLGSTMLAAGVDGGCLDFISSIVFSFFLSLGQLHIDWNTVWKKSLNANQPTLHYAYWWETLHHTAHLEPTYLVHTDYLSNLTLYSWGILHQRHMLQCTCLDTDRTFWLHTKPHIKHTGDKPYTTTYFPRYWRQTVLKHQILHPTQW